MQDLFCTNACSTERSILKSRWSEAPPIAQPHRVRVRSNGYTSNVKDNKNDTRTQDCSRANDHTGKGDRKRPEASASGIPLRHNTRRSNFSLFVFVSVGLKTRASL
mmetsp:Transcript_69969/g.146300  ORF Transcript_69969/g.146300 Transcript_69969/m.146300 type:complete len:106 (-) Transcript_69969:323-640(-)